MIYRTVNTTSNFIQASLGRAGIHPESVRSVAKHAVETGTFVASQLPGLTVLAMGFTLNVAFRGGLSLHRQFSSLFSRET